MFCLISFLHNNKNKNKLTKPKIWQDATVCAKCLQKVKNDFRCIRYHKMLQNIKKCVNLMLVRAKEKQKPTRILLKPEISF